MGGPRTGPCEQRYFEGVGSSPSACLLLFLAGASAVMVMALLVLSIGIFPPRTSLWSASKSTTHVVRARNVGFCKSWANSCARTGDLDGARHRVALKREDDTAPPVEEVAADSPGASVAADLAAGEHGGPRQAAFAMAKKARTTLQLCFTTGCFRVK